MADQEVYMDIPALKDMSNNFSIRGENLVQVARSLEALSNVLKTTAFVGLVGGAALGYFIDVIRPYVEQTAEKYEEISTDLLASVEAYERGDESGATRFY